MIFHLKSLVDGVGYQETRDYVADIYHQEKLGVNPPRGFCLIYATAKCAPKTFECLPHFFVSSKPLQTCPLGRFLRLICHMTRFCARKCIFGVRKFRFNI